MNSHCSSAETPPVNTHLSRRRRVTPKYEASAACRMAHPRRRRSLAELLEEHAQIAPLANAYGLASRFLLAELQRSIEFQRTALRIEAAPSRLRAVWTRWEQEATTCEIAETLLALGRANLDLPAFLERLPVSNPTNADMDRLVRALLASHPPR